MDQLLQLQPEQATPEKVPFPCDCPVYIYQDNFIVSHGIVEGIFLHLSSHLEMMYSVNTVVKDQKGMCHNRRELLHGDRLRLRNGCTVDVKRGKKTLRGVVLGICDIPEDDDLRKYTNDTFWYSIQLVDHEEMREIEESGGEIAQVLHEVSPKQVFYRSVMDLGYTEIKSDPDVYKIKNVKEEENIPTSRCRTDADTEGSLTESSPVLKNETNVSSIRSSGVSGFSRAENGPGSIQNASHVPTIRDAPRGEVSGGYNLQEQNPVRCKREYDNTNGSASHDDVSEMTSSIKRRRQDHEIPDSEISQHLSWLDSITNGPGPVNIPEVPSVPFRGDESLETRWKDTDMKNTSSHHKNENKRNEEQIKPRFQHRKPHSRFGGNDFGALIRLLVPQKSVGVAILGPKGSIHKDLSRRTKCFISMNGDEHCCEIILYGNGRSDVDYGVRLLKETALKNLAYQVETRDHIQWITENITVEYFDIHSPRGMVVGDDSDCQERRDRAIEPISSQPKSQSSNIFSRSYRIVIPMEKAAIAGIVIGRGGCEHKRLLKETGCTRIQLTGPEDRVSHVDIAAKYSHDAKEAASMILRIIERRLGRLPNAYICEGNFNF